MRVVSCDIATVISAIKHTKSSSPRVNGAALCLMKAQSNQNVVHLSEPTHYISGASHTINK